MTRRFDSLAMSLRAMELVRTWRNQQWHAQHVNSALISMPDYMIQRMERAAHYLFCRVQRSERRRVA